MKDYMLRAMTKDGQVRIYAALTTDTAACAKMFTRCILHPLWL